MCLPSWIFIEGWAGEVFTYATARSLESASVVTAGLRFGMPVIVYNGAFILRPDTREIV